MRIIKVGNTFRTYDDSLETFDKLPAQNYVVRFQKNSGFFFRKICRHRNQRKNLRSTYE